ncbi:ribonuclease III [Leptolyngbya sp. PCC 6406]|uniref:ribonuclease III n=1 Tax=Leptolyngbya sp. PCC 6406 TaxID=1173264 RepID=UPI0002ABE7C4|nr:ribonuclease III [Leptolyngbya sp. PCC 6406]
MGFHLPQFQHSILFQKAMTHRSYAQELGDDSSDNERLEFLGDAILTFLCGEFLYQTYPTKAEGDLTRIRSSLVDRIQLATFAEKLRLGDHLRLGKGMEKTGGRENPRLLSSAFEALIGAYFLDCNSDVDAVRAYVNPLFQWALAQRGEAEQAANPKSQLQEWSLATTGEIPEYVMVEASGPDHAKQFVVEVRIQGQVYGRGQGQRKQDAEKQAARLALERLGLL